MEKGIVLVNVVSRSCWFNIYGDFNGAGSLFMIQTASDQQMQ